MVPTFMSVHMGLSFAQRINENQEKTILLKRESFLAMRPITKGELHGEKQCKDCNNFFHSKEFTCSFWISHNEHFAHYLKTMLEDCFNAVYYTFLIIMHNWYLFLVFFKCAYFHVHYWILCSSFFQQHILGRISTVFCCMPWLGGYGAILVS